jgi:hypothetical protein
MARLKERTTDRDKRISMQARLAQLKAIRAAGLATPDDLSRSRSRSSSQAATMTSWSPAATLRTSPGASPTPSSRF